MTTNIDIDLASIKTGRHYIIATDGAAIKNPGPGGWGYIKQLWDGEQLLQQAPNAARSEELESTNNRMEMTAVIMAVESIREAETPTIIQTDSEYVLKNFMLYLPQWKTKGWKSSSGWVKNRELWERLDAACAEKTIYWEKVLAHSGHNLNEMADALANAAAEGGFPKGRLSIRKKYLGWFFTASNVATINYPSP
ncbi:ribonuclease HI [Agrobacterium salinitolerans]|uniref:ribonuclease H family protein n=1 Tax=Agrobacterium salinitolerans TaxID=1183413 RepID=UPI0022B80A1D|nr:ribonuclease H [Agrobacterium salinitolerans]MCZ7973386.1 ribonuclease HI [Agrobacterium salinitolerans]